MVRYANDTTCGTVLFDIFFHAVISISQMVVVADEQKVMLTWEHVDDMGNDGLAINLDQRFGNGITSTAKAFAEAGHGDDYLHDA